MTENEFAHMVPPGFPPPPTRAQGLARWAADLELYEKYPDRHVAYLDAWTDGGIDRRVVIATGDGDEFQRLLAALDPEVRRRVELRYIPERDAPLEIGPWR